MLCAQTVLISQRLRNLLAIVSREAINDPCLVEVAGFNKLGHILDDRSFLLFAYIIMQVGPIKGLREANTLWNLEAFDNVGDGCFGGCCCEGHNGDSWVGSSKGVKLGILYKYEHVRYQFK